MLKSILKEAWVPLLFFGITLVVIYQNNKLRKENDRLSDNTEIRKARHISKLEINKELERMINNET